MTERELQEKERISKNLKVYLNEWKEIIILLNEIMVQKIIWYSIIIVLFITSSYLYIWLVNCSILNIIWTVCLCVNVLDYFVCSILKEILPPNNWDQNKEYIFTNISDSVAHFYVTFKMYTIRFFNLRQSNKKLFHSVLGSLLCILLYIGKTYNNLLISYITVLVIFLLPVFNTRIYMWCNNKKLVSS